MNSEEKNRNDELEKSKAALRKKQSQMSFEDKIRSLVNLQKLSFEMRKNTNEKVYVWQID